MIGELEFKILRKKNQITILTSAWLLTQFILYSFFGINPTLESEKYISAAKDLIHNGSLPSIRYLFYLSTTLLIAFCLKLKIGFTGVVLIQLLINFSATLYFYSTLQKLQSNYYSSFITTLILIICIPYQSWNFYLYTESLFYSFSLLFFSSCIRYSKFCIHGISLQLIFLIITIVSRPLGILFLPCWIGYLISKSRGKIRVLLIGLSIIGLIITIYISNLILSNISDWQVLKPAENGYVICEMPTDAKIELAFLKNRSPIYQLYIYIIKYPKEFLSIAMKRAFAFFLLIRNYYSVLHNAYLILLSAILYLPIFLRLNFFIRKKEFNERHTLVIMIFLLFFITICLQCDDYHNRFHNTIIPVFLYYGIFLSMEKYSGKTKNKMT